MTDQNLKVFDGSYQIFYSGVFNIYENKLILDQIEGFKFIFEFKEDKSKKDQSIEFTGNNDQKIVSITLTNFNNVLGIGTTKKLEILTDDDNKKIFFSLHVKALNETTSFKQISITFYKEL